MNVKGTVGAVLCSSYIGCVCFRINQRFSGLWPWNYPWMFSHIFLTCNVTLASLFIISIAGYTREQIIHVSLHHCRFLKLCSDKLESAADSSLPCRVSSVPCGSAFTDNSFTSLVFTLELCLFSITCHLVWTHMFSSVGPFFSDSLNHMNLKSQTVDDKFILWNIIGFFLLFYIYTSGGFRLSGMLSFLNI